MTEVANAGARVPGAMPTVLSVAGYRYFFYSDERDEPAHVHVERGECVAKLWLNPVAVVYSGCMRGRELSRALRIAREHEQQLRRNWDEYFRNKS